MDVPIKDFLKRTPSEGKESQSWKLFRVGVDFETPIEIAGIDPAHFYYLGLWLGDGNKSSNNITNLDEAVLD